MSRGGRALRLWFRRLDLRRLSLWSLLIVLVLAMLSTLVWLAGRYEASVVQAEVDRDGADAIGELRASLSRQIQSLQGLHAAQPGQFNWLVQSQSLLREQREWLRMEWRGTDLGLLAATDSPYRVPLFDPVRRSEWLGEVVQACQRHIVALTGELTIGAHQFFGHDEQRDALHAGQKLAIRIGNFGQDQVDDVFTQLVLA